MPKTNINTERIIPSDEIYDSSLPNYLAVHESGFATDGDALYGVRRSTNTNAKVAEEMYNGSLRDDGSQPWFQATEGHGMYLANHPAATRVPGIKGDTLYGVRVPLDDVEILDVHAARRLRAGHRTAALLHRSRAIVPGIPNPGPKNWDRLYGDAGIVVFAPMALARLSIAAANHGKPLPEMPPRWALVRQPERIQVVSKGTHPKKH